MRGGDEARLEEISSRLERLSLRQERLSVEQARISAEQATLGAEQAALVAEATLLTTGTSHRIITPSPPHLFQVGDTVRIKNALTLLRSDLVATVTKIRGNRVYFTTVSGIKTWRAPNNLSLIERNVVQQQRA